MQRGPPRHRAHDAGGEPLPCETRPSIRGGVDADPGNSSTSPAGSDADDTNGTTPDDEQGIAPASGNPWNDGQGGLIFTVSGGQYVRVSCWVDFNKNGVWTDAGEKVLDNSAVTNTGAAVSRVTGTLPAGLTFPNSFPARCRISLGVGQGTPAPTPIAVSGPIEFGEVEDHIWEFDAGGNDVAPGAPSAATSLAIAPLNTVDVRLTWTNPAPNDAARILGHATNPYFTSATGGFALDQTDSAAPWQYDDPNVRGDPADTRYYIVYGRLGTTDAATPSNRVGLFEFGLVAGTP